MGLLVDSLLLDLEAIVFSCLCIKAYLLIISVNILYISIHLDYDVLEYNFFCLPCVFMQGCLESVDWNNYWTGILDWPKLL